jgi:hypothetical protein
MRITHLDFRIARALAHALQAWIGNSFTYHINWIFLGRVIKASRVNDEEWEHSE